MPYPGTSVAGYSVPKGMHIKPIFAAIKLTSEGLGGGIVKMPEGCKTQNQPMGCGLTNYYSVANLEEVGDPFVILSQFVRFIVNTAIDRKESPRAGREDVLGETETGG